MQISIGSFSFRVVYADLINDAAVSISAGTMYGTLSKMEKDGLICFYREEEKRKLKMKYGG